MKNPDTSAARHYHDSTKHSRWRLRMSRHYLDWANQPIPYKIYSSLAPIPLPTDFPPSARSALDAIGASDLAPERERIPGLATLARLCFFSNGVTKRLRYARGEVAFRAAACTGALFHVEIYLVCGELPDLPAGLYHYGAHDHSLRLLRAGDFRQALGTATGAEPSILQASAVAVCTSTFWRNAWKYQARAYRHSFWDTGTVVANLLAEAAAIGLPARLVLGFADAQVNRLLDVDAGREAAICLVAIGRTTESAPPAPPIQPLDLLTVPLSRKEVDYPAIRAMHAASSLESSQEATTWRGESPQRSLDSSGGALVPLQPLDVLPTDPIETVIRRRGSTRAFAREPITFQQLSTMLDRATRAIPADSFDPGGALLDDVYLIVNAVDGLQSGTYVLHPERRALELLKTGTFRDRAGALALGQELGADAAVNVYFLADLEPLLARFGNRGYRVAQLEAAIRAGKLYLAAYALRLGATGLTFFDDDVTTFFSPSAAGKSVMFLLALGHPLKRRKELAREA